MYLSASQRGWNPSLFYLCGLCPSLLSTDVGQVGQVLVDKNSKKKKKKSKKKTKSHMDYLTLKGI